MCASGTVLPFINGENLEAEYFPLPFALWTFHFACAFAFGTFRHFGLLFAFLFSLAHPFHIWAENELEDM